MAVSINLTWSYMASDQAERQRPWACFLSPVTLCTFTFLISSFWPSWLLSGICLKCMYSGLCILRPPIQPENKWSQIDAGLKMEGFILKL